MPIAGKPSPDQGCITGLLLDKAARHNKSSAQGQREARHLRDYCAPKLPPGRKLASLAVSTVGVHRV